MRDGDGLNIIVINDSPAITGGLEKAALAEAAGLARRGHRVTLVSGAGAADPELAAAGVVVRTTGQLTTLADPKRARAAVQGTWNRASAALVREVLGSSDPDASVAHVHGWAKVLSASVLRAAVDSGLPTIATLHDYLVACPNGAFFNYPRSEICRLTPLSARCVASNCDARSYSHKLWRVGRAAVQRRFGAMPSGVDQFIAPSHFTAEILRPFLPPNAALHVLPNPIAVAHMPAVDASANAGFLFVGRLSHDKGPVLLAQAARIAGVPARFAGIGPEAEKIRRANPDAELIGWLTPDGVQASIRAARALVSASLWYETQGLAPLEAAANGVPAIVSDAGVPREAVADGETGLWFRGGDVDDLAEKLARMQQDDALVSRLGRRAYETFWSGEHDPDSHLDRLETVYRRALRERSSITARRSRPAPRARGAPT